MPKMHYYIYYLFRNITHFKNKSNRYIGGVRHAHNSLCHLRAYMVRIIIGNSCQYGVLAASTTIDYFVLSPNVRFESISPVQFSSVPTVYSIETFFAT